MICYLDASAWVKRYVAERGSRWLVDWLTQDHEIAVSTLGYVEVACVLARKQRNGEISGSVFTRSIDQLDEDLSSFIRIGCDDAVVQIARGLVRPYSLRGYDTLHLASATALRDQRDDERVAVVSCDVELKQAAKGARFAVIDPETEEEFKGRGR